MLYLLHQDVWLFAEARPLLFGFLPPGLSYHAAYIGLVTLLMAALVRWTWPAHLEPPAQLEREAHRQRQEPAEVAGKGSGASAGGADAARVTRRASSE